jgi:hypothetical protein
VGNQLFCHQWLHKRKRAFVQGGIVKTLQSESAPLLLLDTVTKIDPLMIADIVSDELAGGQLGTA